jgi:ribosomal protein S18 acetylase RimI-like enzyme
MRVTFEQAVLADATALAAFERKVADPKLYGPPLDFEAAIREIGKNHFYFIKAGNTVVGTAAYQIKSDKSAYISNVAVLPEFRRRGIAREAMLFFLDKCKTANRIHLVTHPENRNALALYSSLGFKVESRQENYFGDGEPRLILVLERESRLRT